MRVGLSSKVGIGSETSLHNRSDSGRPSGGKLPFELGGRLSAGLRAYVQQTLRAYVQQTGSVWVVPNADVAGSARFRSYRLLIIVSQSALILPPAPRD
jgi:hypothetical protein